MKKVKSMEEIIKKLNNLDKGYSGKKRSISISLSEENIKLLEFIEKSTGLDRSKVMAFALQNSQSLLNTLLDQVKLARMLGFKSPNKMKRAIERATKRLEEKEKKKEYPIS
jgi:hypothetical protein